MMASSTKTRLVGKAPLTLVRTLDRRVAYVYAGKPAPTNITAEERTRLLDGEYLREEKVVDEDASGSGEDGGFDVANLGTPAATKDATLAWVGDNKAYAAQALKAEQDRPVDDQRSTLITALEKIAEPDA